MAKSSLPNGGHYSVYQNNDELHVASLYLPKQFQWEGGHFWRGPPATPRPCDQSRQTLESTQLSHPICPVRGEGVEGEGERMSVGNWVHH